MLIGKFKTNHPFLYAVLLLLAILLWMDGFIFYRDTPTLFEETAPLYSLLGAFFSYYPFLGITASFLFMIIQAFLFNKVITEKNLVDRNSQLPALLFMVLMSSSFSLFGIHPVWFANLFLILALDKIFDVFTEEEVYLEIFNVGFLVSFASLFYLPALFFILLLVASLLIYFFVNIRALLASIMGLITPYIFVVLYYYWFDMLEEKAAEIVVFAQPLDLLSFQPEPFAWVSIIIFGFVGLVSVFKIYFGTLPDKPVRIRRRYKLLLVYLIVALLSVAFSGNHIHIHHGVIMVPLAGIIAGFFQENKKMFWSELFFSLILLLILVGKLARLD